LVSRAEEIVEQPPPGESAELSHHPGPRQYVKIAVVLAIVTALEVGVYYVDALRSSIVAWLIAFAVIKFFLVATWFMHLKFDSKVFRRLFIAGLVLALSVFGFVLWMFFARGGPAPGPTLGG
jgi:cytochrome c oxidase subunit 4